MIWYFLAGFFGGVIFAVIAMFLTTTVEIIKSTDEYYKEHDL